MGFIVFDWWQLYFCGNFHKMNLDAGDDVFQCLGLVDIVVNGDQNGSTQFKAI